MDPIPFSSAAEDLVEVIRSRNAALVIGAGASKPCGAPTGPELVEELKDKFPRANIPPGTDFLRAGTSISDTPPYSRLDVIRFLRDRLGSLSPDDSYRQLPRWYWRAIFTTNYDDLIEQSYRSPTRVQTLQPVHLPYDTATVPRANHLYLFYLQGSITQPPDSVSAPVASWGDFMRTVQDRVPVMQLFKNILVDGGRVVYVGYSFEDFFLDGVLDEAGRRLGQTSMPYGYAIIPDWPEDSAKRHKITKHNIIPVIGTFDDFAGLVGGIAEHGYQRALDLEGHHVAPAAGYSMRVGDYVVNLTESEGAVYSEFFDLMDEDETEVKELEANQEKELAKQFLRGEDLGWLPYRRKWAFKRETYLDLYGEIRDTLSSDLNRTERMVLVHGPAGLGKSVMARQLAFDLYTMEHVPVLVAKPTWRTRPDLRLIDRFFDDVEGALPEDVDRPKAVLIVDEGELVDRTLPVRASRYLQARNRDLLVVVFARTNEYFRIADFAEDQRPSSWGDPHEFAIAETLSGDEIAGLVGHVSTLGVWGESRLRRVSFWIEYLKENYSSSFFDAVYALVEETQVPLSERVRSEYDNLSTTAQTAYRYIAALHQFGLLLKLEVLTRALDQEWPVIDEEVIRGDARSILFAQRVTSDLNVNFRGRTKLISGVVFDHAVPEHADQLALFKQLIGSFNPNDMFGVDELDTLRTLLVQVLGPSGFDNRFAPDEVSELFGVASSVVDDDVIEHHFGLIERDCGRLLSAREHLENAFRLSALLPDDLSVQRESPQNVQNSLAQVIGDLALEALRRKDEMAAGELIAEASEHFYGARSGHFPNAAAFDAHARLLMKRARLVNKPGSKERAVALSEALDVLSMGIDNVNEEHRPDLIALRSELLTELGQQSDAIAELAQEAERGGSAHERARYHVILARVIAFSDGKLAKRKKLRQALSHAVTACELAPDYFDALKLRAELYKEIHPKDVEELHQLLIEAERCEEAGDNYWLLYELGVTSLAMGRYGESAEAFAKLRRVSRGSSSATGVLEVAGKRTGEPFFFEGRVVRRGPNRWVIESDELEPFGWIYFNPHAARYYTARDRDNVEFELGFNYRGPIAVNVKRR